MLRAAVVTAVILLLPQAASQTPSDACTRECDPRDAAVNGNIPKTEGPVRVFLYAIPTSSSGGWELGVHYSPGSETTLVAIGGTDACSRETWPGTGGNPRHAFPLGAAVNLAGPAKLVTYVTRPTTEPGTYDPGPVRIRAELALVNTQEDGPRTIIGQGASEAFGGENSDVTTWEVAIPMDLEEEGIPAWTPGHPLGLQATIELCSEVPVGGLHKPYAIIAGSDFPNRIVLDVDRPLQAAGLRAGMQDGHLCVGVSVLAPFATYDLDEDSVSVIVRGPDGAVHPVPTHLARQDSTRRNLGEPTTPGGCIPSADLTRGISNITASVTNYQGTFTVVQTSLFDIPVVAQTVGPGASAVLVLLAILAFRRHKR